MVKVTLNQLVATKNLLQDIVKLKLKAKYAFSLAKVLEKIISETTKYEEVRSNLVKEYGETDDDGKIGLTPQSEHYEKVVNELNELLSTEIELDFNKLSIDALGDNEIEVEKIIALSYLFDGE
jgi:hypothetical protein